jgi:hypothetical protein
VWSRDIDESAAPWLLLRHQLPATTSERDEAAGVKPLIDSICATTDDKKCSVLFDDP